MHSHAPMVEEFSPGTRIGEYRIERAIAEGGMATVYEARHVARGHRAALKVLHRHLLGRFGARERLLQEASILRSFDHPGLVRLVDAGLLEDDRPWLAMELLEGATLAQAIHVHGALHPLEVCNLLVALTGALASAHRAGVVHRDLKPENIMIARGAESVRILIVDWGIARVDPAPSVRLTAADLTPGTPFYMSPEQARGRELDGASDVYALGVITYEMLTGHLPYVGECALDVVIHHLRSPVPRVRAERPEIPLALDQLVVDMMAKDLAARPTLGAVEIRADAIRSGRTIAVAA